MNYKLTTITPIHIGNGNKLTKPFDFIVAGNSIGVLSFDKYLSLLTSSEIENLEKLIESGDYENIYNKIRKPLDGYLKYIVQLNAKNNTSPKEIAEHIKTVFNEKGEYGVYIPGSTIKGFIRLAILYKILKENLNSVKCEKESDIIKVEENKFSILLNQDDKKKLSLMAYFKVSDSKPISVSSKPISVSSKPISVSNNLEVRRVISLNGKISEYVEVIKEKTSTDIKISISIDDVIEKLRKPDDKHIEAIKNWKQACYEFSKDIIDFEIGFFKARNKNLKEFYENLKKQNSPDSPILRIGKYKGKISQTLILLKDKNKIRCLNSSEFPKTRRITDNDSLPLGWIQLEKVSDKA